MYRRIVNRHKLKKQIGRNIYKSRSFLHSLLHKEDRHRRDFSWQGREENPYATHENSTWKKKIYAITIVISLLLTIATLLKYSIYPYVAYIVYLSQIYELPYKGY